MIVQCKEEDVEKNGYRHTDSQTCHIEAERYENSVYFPITNKYLLFLDNVSSSNTIF